MAKKFFQEINVARGILVTLVVLGHVIVFYSENVGVPKIISFVTYSFHMYAFFFISGFVCLKIIQFSSFQEKLNYTKKRASRLLIPYLVMGVIYLPVRLFGSSIARNDYALTDIWKVFIGVNPDGALWFLYVLFIFSTLACFFVKFKWLKIAIIITFIISISTDIINYGIPLNYFLEFPAYFLLGMLVRDNYDRLQGVFSNYKYALVSFLIFASYNFLVLECHLMCFKIITALSGIFCFMYISITLSNNLIINKLGDYSMDIYIFSEPVKVIIRTVMRNTNALLNLSSQFILSMIVPIIISSLIVRRFKPLRRLFLGMD